MIIDLICHVRKYMEPHNGISVFTLKNSFTHKNQLKEFPHIHDLCHHINSHGYSFGINMFVPNSIISMYNVKLFSPFSILHFYTEKSCESANRQISRNLFINNVTS